MAYIKAVKNKKGISYQVNIRKEGFQPLYKTFKGERAEQRAKKWAKQIESEMELGIYKEFVDNDYHIEYMSELIDYYNKEVAQTKVEAHLYPMNSFERRIIHSKLSDWRDVYTESEGEDKERHIVIKPRNK